MKTSHLLIVLSVAAALLFAGCSPQLWVGELQTETRSVELADAGPVRVEITQGAGELQLTGGAEKLLEADFNYNVARLKPEVKYKNGKLEVWQPDAKGVPVFNNLANFRNEWGLRLSDAVPLDLHVDMGAGSSALKLAGLSLTGLEVNMGAGEYDVDLTGSWSRNLNVKIASGAAIIRVRLPKDVGTRVEIESGPHTIETAGLSESGGIYTNAAYGVSGVTMQVNIEAGIGHIDLEVE